MQQGISLDDNNRLPWLLKLRELLMNWHTEGKNGVLSCSALRGRYRDLLNSNINYNKGNESTNDIDLNLLFVLLNFDQDSIEKRLSSRKDHPILKDSRILKSQFEILEIPEENQILGHVTLGVLNTVKFSGNDSSYFFYNMNLTNKVISVKEIVINIKEMINKFFNH